MHDEVICVMVSRNVLLSISHRQKGCCMTMPAIVSKDRYPVTHTEDSRWSRELVKLIAKDVGDAVITHIETMYPAAFAATPGTFPLSVRNCVFNEIMAAVEVNDAGEIAARLANRRRARRVLKTAYRKMRAADKD
jgi:hypothetical protein